MADHGLFCHPHSTGWFKCKSLPVIQPENFLIAKYILPQKMYTVNQELLIFVKRNSYRKCLSMYPFPLCIFFHPAAGIFYKFPACHRTGFHGSGTDTDDTFLRFIKLHTMQFIWDILQQ